MTLPRMDAIAKRWSSIPPVSVSLVRIGAALGIKPKAKAAEAQGSMEELASMLGQSGISSEKPEWLTKTT